MRPRRPGRPAGAPGRPPPPSKGRHSMVEHDVKNLSLAADGRLKIEWAEQSMPVLRQVRERFTQEQPLKGIRLGACLHVTTETAVLMLTLKAAGAQLALCASNPLSTQDDTAAALVEEYDVAVYAHKGEDHARYYRHIAAVLATRPQVTMDDGAILANAGHFNVELDLATLGGMAKSHRRVRPFVEEYTLQNGRRLFVLGEGRLINLAAAEGHPASVMDMSFANQALAAEHMVTHGRSLAKRVYGVPREIDLEIARLKLASMGVEIDALTPAQREYLASWTHGT